MADLCDVSLLPTNQCAHCTTQPHDQPANSHPFTARFHSTCTGCGFTINPGETVRYTADRLHHDDHPTCTP